MCVPVKTGATGPQGPQGEPGEVDIDDTAGTGVLDKTWSANKLTEINTNIATLNSNISNFRTLQVQDENELDTALTNYDRTCMYLAILNDGSGMILGQYISSIYQSQMKLSYWNTKIQRRVKNSANWGSWVDIA